MGDRLTALVRPFCLLLALGAAGAVLADEWEDAGFEGKSGQAWRSAGFDLPTARAWKQVVTAYPHPERNNLEEAALWRGLGWTPEHAQAFVNLQGDLSEARRLAAQGLRGLAALNERRRGRGLPPLPDPSAPVAVPAVSIPTAPAPIVGAPRVAAPVVGAPVVSAPAVSAPVLTAPAVRAPVIAAPVVATPVYAAPAPQTIDPTQERCTEAYMPWGGERRDTAGADALTIERYAWREYQQGVAIYAVEYANPHAQTLRLELTFDSRYLVLDGGYDQSVAHQMEAAGARGAGRASLRIAPGTRQLLALWLPDRAPHRKARDAAGELVYADRDCRPVAPPDFVIRNASLDFDRPVAPAPEPASAVAPVVATAGEPFCRRDFVETDSASCQAEYERGIAAGKSAVERTGLCGGAPIDDCLTRNEAARRIAAAAIGIHLQTQEAATRAERCVDWRQRAARDGTPPPFDLEAARAAWPAARCSQ
jgi:hypothetical protein